MHVSMHIPACMSKFVCVSGHKSQIRYQQSCWSVSGAGKLPNHRLPNTSELGSSRDDGRPLKIRLVVGQIMDIWRNAWVEKRVRLRKEMGWLCKDVWGPLLFGWRGLHVIQGLQDLMFRKYINFLGNVLLHCRFEDVMMIPFLCLCAWR